MRDVWIAGDSFLISMFSKLQALNSSAVSTNKTRPFIYEMYNVSAWTGSGKKCITRIVNALVAALNEKTILPKYILMVIDRDIIMDTEKVDRGYWLLIEDQIEWVQKQITKVLTRRREDLKYKRAGSLPDSTEPKVIWIKIINRPYENNESSAIKYNPISKRLL